MHAALALLFAVLVPLLISVALIDPAAASSARAAASSAGAAATRTPGRAEAAARAPGTGPSAAQSTTSTASAATASTGAAPSVDADYPYVGYLKPAITGITPTVVTSSAGDLMTVTGTITNVSKGTVYDLRYVWQRGNALPGVTAIKAEITDPGRPAAVVGQDWKILGATATPTAQTDIAAGATLRFVATVRISDDDGLAIRTPGVYPLMIKVSGDIGQNGQTQYERVGEVHLLATVLSVPPATAHPSGTSSVVSSQQTPTQPGTTALLDTTGDSDTTAEGAVGTSGDTASGRSADSTTDIPTQGFATSTASSSAGESSDASGSPGAAASSTAGPGSAAGATSGTSVTGTAVTTAATTTATTPAPTATGPTAPVTLSPVALNVLWPLVDTPHVGVGGIFLNDRLAQEIAAGGRLDVILSNLIALNTGASSTTIVIDPELLDEIQQMSEGYRVVSPPGVPQPALTPATTAPSTGSSVTSVRPNGPPATTARTAASGVPTSDRHYSAGDDFRRSGSLDRRSHRGHRRRNGPAGGDLVPGKVPRRHRRPAGAGTPVLGSGQRGDGQGRSQHPVGSALIEATGRTGGGPDCRLASRPGPAPG